MKVFKVGSLFAGVGGIDLGFEQAKVEGKKYEIIFANEIDPIAANTYAHNFNSELILGDIEKIVGIAELENEDEAIEYFNKRKIMFENSIDILVGGFPCQAFSIAGDQLGFEDHRGNLFWSIVEYIKIHERKHGFKPRVLFLENVKNLRGHDGGNTYKVIKNEIEKLGYTIKDSVMNTYLYSNLPQTRERIYIACFLNPEDAERFTWFETQKPQKKSKDELIQSIQSVLDFNLPDKLLQKYLYTPEKYPKYFSKDENGINLNRDINQMYEFYQVRRSMYVRHNKSGVSPTLTANMGTGGHNVPLILSPQGIRKLTPKETFKLQGFPIDAEYKLPKLYNKKPVADSHFYKQAGNAVSVPIIKLNAEKILEALD